MLTTPRADVAQLPPRARQLLGFEHPHPMRSAGAYYNRSHYIWIFCIESLCSSSSPRSLRAAPRSSPPRGEAAGLDEGIL
jgi:hypothetical protein